MRDNNKRAVHYLVVENGIIQVKQLGIYQPTSSAEDVLDNLKKIPNGAVIVHNESKRFVTEAIKTVLTIQHKEKTAGDLRLLPRLLDFLDNEIQGCKNEMLDAWKRLPLLDEAEQTRILNLKAQLDLDLGFSIS